MRLPRFWTPRSRDAVIGAPYLWLGLFFLLPFMLVLRISLAQMDGAQVSPLVTLTGGELTFRFHLTPYLQLLSDDLYLHAYLVSLKYALVTTVLCLLIGYPFAYFMARSEPRWQPALLMGVMLPFWTSFLLRVYAWKGLLDADTGWVGTFLNTIGADKLLLPLGLISAEGQYMYTPFSLILGMVYTYLPFMILPLYGTLSKLDLRLLEAAYDLGARPWKAFLRITLPLSRSGIIAGCMLVMIPAVGEFVIPEMLGGPDTLMIGRVLWGEFFNNRDWPAASAVAIVMLLLLLVPILVFNRFQQKEMEGRLT